MDSEQMQQTAPDQPTEHYQGPDPINASTETASPNDPGHEAEGQAKDASPASADIIAEPPHSEVGHSDASASTATVPAAVIEPEPTVPEHSPEAAAPEEKSTPLASPPATAKSQASNAWWDGLEFEGKEFTELSTEGNLILKATPFSPERNLTDIHPETATAVIHALRERFQEVALKVSELAREWGESDDKSKLSNKVARVSEYLQHAVAIGDFVPLYQQAARWDNILQESADKAYAERLALVEKAESIANGEAVKDATMALRDISEKWKKLSHTDKERADGLWNRLEAARNKFYEQKREMHEAEIAELSSNLDLKNEIVDKAEKLAASDDWKEATDGFKTLMDEWKSTGRTFNDKNEALWQRFISAKNVFYERKRQHFESIQTEQETNYNAKLALVAEAEGLAENTDWGKTSNAYTAIMDKWKHIGRVPIDKADELWDRLSKAKDIFFNAKRQHFATIRVGLDDNYAQKSALVKHAQQLQNSNDWRGATDEFAELMEEWKKIGPVAKEHSEPLWESFIKARRNFFNRKDADRDRRRGQIERAQSERKSQTQQFLKQLRDELKEDEENLADYHLSLGNLGTGKMDAQIKANLEKLISQAEPKMQKKREKIATVEAQLAEMSQSHPKKNQEDKKNKQVDKNRSQTAPEPKMTEPEPAQDAPKLEQELSKNTSKEEMGGPDNSN